MRRGFGIRAYRSPGTAAPPPPPSGDPNFPYVTLLLPGDGTNGAQNNTFLDASTNNFTVTRNGNTTQGTFSPYGDNWSNYFDGTGDYLSVANASALQLSNAVAWTIEFWFYATSLPASQHVVNAYNPSSPFQGWGFAFGTAGNPASTLAFWDGGSWTTVASGVTVNAWNHVAVSYTGSGTNCRVFFNGTQVGSAFAPSSNITNTVQDIAVGATNNNLSWFNGYISNVRIVKGTAVYTGAFTPSTTPLTAITNTSLLTCQSNRIRDASTNNFTITRNGDVRVQRFSPFSPTASYSASTIGGSGYFDGVGDYLSVPDNAALDLSGDFTIEFWMRPVPRAGEDFPRLISKGDYQTATTSWVVIMQAGVSNKTGFWYGNPATELNIGNAPPNTWTHIAIARSGTTLRSFFNGTLVSTNTTSADFTSTDNVLIGAGSLLASTQLFSGYISNLRILKGTAQYTASFTPPTAPVTAITNTSLLLNFTNAGIIDNAMMNDAETVGNAQISTAQSKFGGGSMLFDGTGDWLTAPHSVTQQLGSGNFTVEGWLRINATGVAYGVVSKGTATTGYSVNVTSGNKLQFSYTATQLTGATSLASNTWYHFAVVRNGTATGNLVLYLDGVADATSAGAVTDNFNQTNIQYVGASRTGGDSLNGYIDDLRITNGVARYTANFTPPTAAFPTL